MLTSRMPRTPLVSALLLSTAAALGGCAREEPASPSVLVIVVDALRADHVGAHGYARDTTPALDALAARGVLFERAVSPSNQTRSSMPSIWTGLLPSRHGVFRRDDVVREELTTLAEILRGRGWATAAWCPNPSLDRSLGHSQGFELYEDRDLQPRVTEPAWEGFETARPITDRFLAWLDEGRRGRPYLAWLHYRDVHGPYLPPPSHSELFEGEPRPLTPEEIAARPEYLTLPGEPEDLSRYVALYDGEARYTDDHVARILAELERRGELESTWVIVTADHGEGFLEHGTWDHGVSLFEEELQVPLVVAGPGLEPRRVGEVVSTLDLFPTLLELLGLPVPENDGESLVPLLEGRPGYLRDAALSEAPSGTDDVARALRAGDWKLIADWRSRSVGLFDLASDPAETVNRFEDPAAASERERLWARLRDLGRELEAARQVDAPKAELSEELRENLESLGYVR